MSGHTTATVSIDQYLSEPLRLGEPTASGPLTIHSVFGPEPGVPYVSLKQAIERGNLTVKELPGGASVRDLVVENSGRHNVLVFEGEEVLGAQQNRTFDISVLVPSGARLTVPVSCVEAGRWDGRRHRESFAAAPQTADPGMRSDKVRQSTRNRIAGLETRADQAAVWGRVEERSQTLGVSSPTASMHDVYESRRARLAEITAGIEPCEGQIGMVAVAGGEIIAFDLISRPEVFEQMFQPLLQGYALDALVSGNHVEAGESGPNEIDAGQVDEELVARFVEAAGVCRILEGDGIGLGRDFRFESADLLGAGLVSGDELVQLSVFPAERRGDHDAELRESRQTRIARPSRRRGRPA
ncbi:MAG: hypothetical protein J0H66_00005 [Solirubrobacterales bacterium]|nr:hypothetical protein [Solirubrobacterales bacterium]